MPPSEPTGSVKVPGGRRRRLIRSAGAEGVSQVVTVATQILGVPIFLAAWGVDLYGVWLLLATVPAYAALADFGLVTVAYNRITALAAAEDRGEALEVFQTAWLTIVALSLVFLAAVAAVGALLPLDAWLQEGGLSHGDALLTLLLLTVGALMQVQMALLWSPCTAAGRYAEGSLIQSSIRIGAFLAIAGVLLLGGQPIAAATASAVVFLVGAAGMAAYARRVTPWLPHGTSAGSRARLRELAAPAFGYLAFPVGVAANLQLGLVLVGALLGPAAVVVFSTHRTMTRLIGQMVGAVNLAVRPELAMAFGVRDFDTMRRLHRLSCQIALWVSLLAVVGAMILGELAIRVWTGGEVEVDRPLLAWLLLGSTANVLWLTSATTVWAANRHSSLAPWYLGTVAVGLGAGWLAGVEFSSSGIDAGLVLGEVLAVALLLSAALRLVGDAPRAFLGALIRPRITWDRVRRSQHAGQ